MSEVWKDITGYEGLYQVSNLGFVRSLHPHSCKIVNPTILKGDDVHGYPRVELHRRRTKTKHLVHRLVAVAFIPNPDNKPEVNHKDGKKDNNCVDNLEWCTRKENMKHAYDNGLVSMEKANQARLGK